MSIIFKCTECGAPHPCRMLALRRKYFEDVVPQLGEVIELCPHTRKWMTINYAQMIWKDTQPAADSWI